MPPTHRAFSLEPALALDFRISFILQQEHVRNQSEIHHRSLLESFWQHQRIVPDLESMGKLAYIGVAVRLATLIIGTAYPAYKSVVSGD